MQRALIGLSIVIMSVACGKKDGSTAEPTATSPPKSLPPASSPLRVKTKGISVAVAQGWNVEKSSDPRDGELTIREDKPDTETHVAGGAFVSRGPAKAATTAEECAAKGQNMAHAPAKLRSTSWDTTALGPTCHIALEDDRMVILSQSIGVAGDQGVVFNCYYDLHDAGPSPACAEMFASLKLED